MNNPLVSIIIPTYNRAHLIGETLDSILAQTYTNWECIVVDDGSSDNTDKLMVTYCKKDKRFQYHYRTEDRPKGANACRNYGFEMCAGDYLIFLDSDDLLENYCIELRYKNILKIKSSDEILVFNMGLLINRQKTNKNFNEKCDSNFECLKKFLTGNVPWTITCVFWGRETFIKVGRFDENLARLQDVDLHTRLLLNGFKINKVEITDSWYRILDNMNDYTSKEKLPIIVKSYIQYINKYFNYSEEIFSEISIEEINSLLKVLFLTVLKKYVFKDELVCYDEMMRLNKKNDILRENKLFWIKLLALYYKLNLQKKRGVGYYITRIKALN